MLFWETGAVGHASARCRPGGPTFRVPPTGAVLGTRRDRLRRRPARARAAIATRPPPLRGLVRRRRVRPVGRAGRRGRAAEPAACCDVGSFGYDFRTVDMRAARAPDRRRGARRAVRLRLPRRRDRAAPGAGRAARRAAREHRHVVELLHAGVRRALARTRSGVSRRTSRRRPRSTRPALRPERAAPCSQRANDAYDATLGRGHEPGRARRLLRRVGAVHRRAARRPTALTPADVAAAAARDRSAAAGSLPNGSGLRFGAPGTADAGDNVAAASVIWEWVAPGEAAVVWPPAFATEPDGSRAPSDAWSSRRRRDRRRAGGRGGLRGARRLSGHLSPLARGPLLDGIGPPQDYRWVNPPPELAATNQTPSSGVFHVALGPVASEAQVFVTSDNQVTVVVPQGCVRRRRPGRSRSTLTVDPVDPATLAPPGSGVTIFGNAYRFRRRTGPSGDAGRRSRFRSTWSCSTR